jgi:glutamate decarboxylase
MSNKTLGKKSHIKSKKTLKSFINKATKESLHNKKNVDYPYYVFDGKTEYIPVIIPTNGTSENNAYELINQELSLDTSKVLNACSYVSPVHEDKEDLLVIKGAGINVADSNINHQTNVLMEKVVNMVAELWNCPKNEDYKKYGTYCGTHTNGSSEACMLGALSLKYRWKYNYSKKHNISMGEMYKIRPNMIISPLFQVCWEKIFMHFDIEPRIVPTSLKDMRLDHTKLEDYCDENTICVVGILGNHYTGHYDSIKDINSELNKINEKNNWNIGIHVDAASGGFVAPFRKSKIWDFRLNNVLSINGSGHKYGQSLVGAGWVIWRYRKNFSDYVNTQVRYLGGIQDSFTLNFSKPASSIYSQLYKFLRLGMEGYRIVTKNQYDNAILITTLLKEFKYNGKPRFEIFNKIDMDSLPVISMRLNPKLKLKYNDIDFQNAMSMTKWYIGSYLMQYTHPITKKQERMFYDEDRDNTMFRITVKTELSKELILDSLITSIDSTLKYLDNQKTIQIHGVKEERHVGTHGPC